LLDPFANESKLTHYPLHAGRIDYSRELAPLAGITLPALGPSWWFNDSPEGMMRFREQTTETAGFLQYRSGFNDEHRAFLSIPARHDVARA